MNSLDGILAHLEPFLLVLFRMSGLFIFAPAISSPIIPARARALMTIMFALAVYPFVTNVTPRGIEELDVLSLGITVASETMIGLVIGLVGALPMYAVQLGGLIMGQQMGLGLANVYNPALDVESDTVGQLLLYLALTIFLMVGGLEVLFVSTAHTFTRIPPGAMTAGGGDLGVLSASMLDLFLGVLASGFELALRVAAPVLCLILLETIAVAFIMKTIPQLNIMSIGFATKVLVAFVGLLLSIGAVTHAIGDDTGSTLQRIVNWAENVGPIAPGRGGDESAAGAEDGGIDG